jgi:predicted metalloprotease
MLWRHGHNQPKERIAMRWRGMRESINVEDRRRISPGMAIGGGIGIGTFVLLIIALLSGADPMALLQRAGGGGGAGMGMTVPDAVAPSPAEDQAAKFVSVILADTEDVWNEQFRKMGLQYVEPRLVLFRGHVQSACGMASSAVGPFYCSEDQHVYLDLGFFDELDRQFGAPGDFAQAYVIAHEIGHHVQNLLGLSNQVQRLRSRVGEEESNALSVRLELQADFLAGVWAHHAQRSRQILEPGDLEEGLRAASAIGDDRIQMRAQGYVVPDAFTHGTSAQREWWFRKGLETGDIRLANSLFTVAGP